MSLSQLETDQFKDKSITSAKLADTIAITTSLSSPTITVPSITSSTFSVKMGDPIVIDSATIDGVTRRAKGLAIKNGSVDLFHVDDIGDVYIKGNLNIGGVVNSTTTTVNTMEVADYEIILNASVSTPYTSGARLSVNRGGANYDPYIGWNETNKYWELYDGTTTARVIDISVADGKYAALAGATFTGPVAVNSSLTVTGGNYLSLKAGSTSDYVYMQFFADSQAQTTRSAWFGYPNAGSTSFTMANEMVNGSIVLAANGSGKILLSSTPSLTTNKLEFNNGSYISNETDSSFNIVGDGTIVLLDTSSAANYVKVMSTGLYIGVNSETYSRIAIQSADGKIGFGPGGSTRDAWLYRDNTNSLKTDGALNVVGAITTSKVNKVTITTPATGSTLTIADGKTLTCNNSITFSASNDTSSLNIGTGGTLGSAAFAATTAFEPAITNGTANRIYGMNAAANAKEWKSLATGTSGTAPAFAHTANTVTLNIPLASTASVTAGLLSNTDYAKIHDTHPDATATTKGYVQVGTGIGVASGVISVNYGTTATTACVGNDSRLSNARTPVEHGDSVHNNVKYARITYTGGTQNIGYQWNHGLNSANIVFTIVANSPETHYYYTIVDNNNVKIYLDDSPYETIILDATATLIDATHLTTATANLTT